MVSEAIDYNKVLLDNYKKMRISEVELCTIIMIQHLIEQGNPFVTADLLSLKMSLDVKEIDKVLAGLFTRGIIEYKTKGKTTITSLDPLKIKLRHEFQVSLSNEEESEKSEAVIEELENIFETFERLLGRSLSPVEVQKIREWVAYGYSDGLIINALKESISKGKKSLRSVDKILLTWASREDIENEGHTTISNDWNKNLEETIRIAKTPWLIDDDDK